MCVLLGPTPRTVLRATSFRGSGRVQQAIQLRKGTAAIGLRGYRFDGSIRFHAFDGRPIVAARAQGQYAYAAGLGQDDTTVIDLRDGRVLAPDAHAISVSPFELLVGATP